MTLRDTALVERLKEQIRKLIDLIEEAHDNLYPDQKHPGDCKYCAAIKESEEVLYRGSFNIRNKK